MTRDLLKVLLFERRGFLGDCCHDCHLQPFVVFCSEVSFLFQSETCRVEIPELEFELGMGALGGKFTTLEGLLKDIQGLVSERGAWRWPVLILCVLPGVVIGRAAHGWEQGAGLPREGVLCAAGSVTARRVAIVWIALRPRGAVLEQQP